MYPPALVDRTALAHVLGCQVDELTQKGLYLDSGDLIAAFYPCDTTKLRKKEPGFELMGCKWFSGKAVIVRWTKVFSPKTQCDQVSIFEAARDCPPSSLGA